MKPADVLRRGQHLVVDGQEQAATAPAHDERTAAILGAALGVCFLTCFLTGLISHEIQHPATWFHWPARPAGLYRFTQGLHVATGLASIPLLLAKLWSVFPHLVKWPPFRSAAHAVERLMLLPLVCGSAFMLFTGMANIAHWYPWHFSFTRTHYAIAWVTMGAMLAHIGAKFAITRRELLPGGRITPARTAADGVLSRRAYLGWTAAAVGLVTVTTIGQTVRPLRRLGLFAPRRPDDGPQGLPVNGVPSAQVVAAGASAAYRFTVKGDVATPLSLTIDQLRALPRRAASLPITCVEGWSAQADWEGVAVHQLLTAAGVPDDAHVEVRVESFQQGAYQFSMLSDDQARDRDALIALELNGEVLHPHHGYPARLIAPNRPGVQQTKWVEGITVTVS